MAKSKKAAQSKKSIKSTARVVKTEKLNETAKSTQSNKPRVRKTETVRERNEKVAAKMEAKANKQPKQRVRKITKKVTKPLSKPASLISRPFRTKPVKAVGRFLGRIFWPKYFRNSWKEIKLVTWPSRKDTWKLTFAVLMFALIFGLAAAGTDFVLDKIIRRIVFRG